MDRLVDYFAVCGLPSTPELMDSSRALEAERARDIMDIAVVFGNDEPPDGFMTIMHTPNGNSARFDQMQMSGLESNRNSNVYLAYRRRDRDEHGPAISAIEVLVYCFVLFPASKTTTPSPHLKLNICDFSNGGFVNFIIAPLIV
jgi:hypothetical protein